MLDNIVEYATTLTIIRNGCLPITIVGKSPKGALAAEVNALDRARNQQLLSQSTKIVRENGSVLFVD